MTRLPNYDLLKVNGQWRNEFTDLVDMTRIVVPHRLG